MRCMLTILLACVTGLSISQDRELLMDIINDPHSGGVRQDSAIIELSKSYQYQDPDSAVQVLLAVLERSEANEANMNMVHAYYGLSQIFSTKGQFKKALEYDLALRDLGVRMNNTEIHASALNNLGEDYFDQGAYTTAYDYYQKSRRKSIEAQDSLLIAISTYNLGKVLIEQEQYDRARYYLEKSRQISDQIGDQEGIVYCDIKLAKIELNSGKNKEALDKLIVAENAIETLEIHSLKPAMYDLFAHAYEKEQQYNSALAYYTKMGEFHEKVGNLIGVGHSSLGKGSVMMELGDYYHTREYLENALTLARRVSNKELLRDTYYELAVLNEKETNFRQSLEYYKLYFELKDSIQSQQRNEQFANMQLMHETAQKDAEIRIMQEREDQQKAQLESEEFKNNILVVILALGVVLIMNLYRSSVKRKKINSTLMAHKHEIEKKSREMEGLLSMKDKFLSIISHDLRSPINSLVGTIDMLNEGQLSPQESKGLMSSLKNRLNNTRKLLDNLLDWALVQMDEVHIKMKELDLYELVQQNIELFHETNEKQIIFFNKVSRGTRVIADSNMLELIIRNLVVNSIKFTQEGGYIEVETENSAEEHDHITVCIADNGIGMTREQAEKLFDSSLLYSTPGTRNEQGTGLGLKLCKEFVERMDGKIWVESTRGEGSIFKFTLKIPDTP